MEVIERFKEKAKKSPKRMVFPEGENEKIIAAAAEVSEQGMADAVLIGKPENIYSSASNLTVDMEEISIFEPETSGELERYSNLYSRRRKEVSEKIARRLIRKHLFFGAMMVSAGDADGMVAGVDNPTVAVLQAAGLAVGYTEGVSAPSSFFIMVVPEFEGRQDKILIFADAAVNISPTARQLAEVAVTSGRNATKLLGIEPQVALLSFSTKGSASHADVDKVIEATKIAQEMAPDMAVDGELQADAALIPRVGQKKAGASLVAGRANVLVFPDLDAANIAYKLTQYLAKAKAYGPFLQGFAKPVSDLSRGATVEDIVGVTAVTVVQAQGVQS